MNAIVVSQQFGVPDMERMAKAFAGSKLFGVTNPEQALALCLIAQAEGRHPASAAQDYHIIQGKPSKKADAMLRDFLAGGGKVEWHALTDEIADATFSHPAGGSVRITWDMERARQAQLNTPMWKKFPRQMLRSRVVSEGVRTVFPMATSGMYVPEEVQEFDAPREVKDVTPEPTTERILIEGATDEPEQLSKYAAKKLAADMIAEMRACQTLEELSVLWNSRPFKDAYLSLPSDWQTGENSITAEKEELKELLAGTHPSQQPKRVEPNFDHLATTDDDSHAKAQWKASVAMEKLANMLATAESPEALKMIWDSRVQAPAGSELLAYLQAAYAKRARDFGMAVE